MSRQQQSQSHVNPHSTITRSHQDHHLRVVHPQKILLSKTTVSQPRPPRPSQQVAPSAHPPGQVTVDEHVVPAPAPPLAQNPVPGPTAAPSTMHDTMRTIHRMNTFMDTFSDFMRSNGSRQIIQSDQSQSRNQNGSGVNDTSLRVNETRATNEVLATVNATHLLQLRALRKVEDRVRRLEKSIGLSAGGDLWMRRLAAIEGAVGVLARDHTRAIAPSGMRFHFTLDFHQFFVSIDAYGPSTSFHTRPSTGNRYQFHAPSHKK